MSQVQALPVISGGRVAGIVTEKDVLSRLASGSAGTDAVEAAVEPNPPCANAYMTVEQAADMMNTTGADVLPVIDEFGSYRGIVTRSDVLASMLDVTRPPSVAGMATPLGVHLTTGAISAGAGSLGLYLAGAALVLMMEAAGAILWLAAFLTDKLFHLHLIAMLNSPVTGAMTRVDMIHYIFVPLQMVLMLLLLRFSPMSSYHAAEHQVVHAIEAGEPLTPGVVSRMPRAHPRCGTNLMAAATLFLIIAGGFGNEFGAIIALIVMVAGWRTVGYYLQQYVTTKPAGDKYIQNGIKVGEELLAKYRRQPSAPVEGWTRIWNMGLPQVAMGFMTVMAIVQYVLPQFGISPWF
jgi:hypothetical protein